MFALYAAPGVNLFDKTLDRITVESNQHEYPVIPDRSRPLDFETNRVTSVFAHIPGAPQKIAGRAALLPRPPRGLRRASATRSAALPRRPTVEEKKYGQKSPTMPAPTSSCRSASAPIRTSSSASPN